LYEEIGLGGMAEIFLAKTFTGLGSERHFAIKRILPNFIKDDSFGEMLIKEAKLCAQLTHANVVSTIELGKTDGRYYIAMEYVEGFDLNKLLGMLARAKLALPLQFALYIVAEVLRALDYAHRLTNQHGQPLGIIHRDVSPTNVLISTEGEIKLCDFGIAKVTMGDLGMDNIDEHHLKGKFAYMAPEYLNGQEIDHRADLFAAGILLWELLSGRRLYKAKREEETLMRAKAAEISPLVDRGFPEYETLNSIVLRSLVKDRDMRFQTGKEFIDAIEDYLQKAELMVSQLKFSDFLMEHFGEKLLEQRRERERSLGELYEYQKEMEAKELGERSSRSSKSAIEDAQDNLDDEQMLTPEDKRAEAILATFSDLTDLDEEEVLDFDNEEPSKVAPLPKALETKAASAPQEVKPAANEEKRSFAAALIVAAAAAALIAAAAFIYFYFGKLI
jgi:serine/threonine protein kinase